MDKGEESIPFESASQYNHISSSNLVNVKFNYQSEQLVTIEAENYYNDHINTENSHGNGIVEAENYDSDLINAENTNENHFVEAENVDNGISPENGNDKGISEAENYDNDFINLGGTNENHVSGAESCDSGLINAEYTNENNLVQAENIDNGLSPENTNDKGIVQVENYVNAECANGNNLVEAENYDNDLVNAEMRNENHYVEAENYVNGLINVENTNDKGIREVENIDNSLINAENAIDKGIREGESVNNDFINAEHIDNNAIVKAENVYVNSIVRTETINGNVEMENINENVTVMPKNNLNAMETDDVKVSSPGLQIKVMQENSLNKMETDIDVNVSSPNHQIKNIQSTDEKQKVLKPKNTLHIPKKVKYRCTHCGKSFLGNDKLQRHMITHNSERPFSCTLCSLSFKRRDHLQRHSKVSHGCDLSKTELLICEFCNKKYFKKGEFEEHIEEHINSGKNISYTCPRCNLTFNRRPDLLNHMTTHKSIEWMFGCKTCGQYFKLKMDLVNHSLEKHKDDTPSLLFCCSLCNQSFQEETYFDKHILTHSNNKPFACQYCDLSFKRKVQLSRHTQSHIELEVYIKKSNKGKMGKKMKPTGHKYFIHNDNTDGMQFHCKTCEKRFKLKNYIKTNINKRRFTRVPDTCSESYVKHNSYNYCNINQSANLELHINDNISEQISSLQKNGVIERNPNSSLIGSIKSNMPYGVADKCEVILNDILKEDNVSIKKANRHIKYIDEMDNVNFRCVYCDKKFDERYSLLTHITSNFLCHVQFVAEFL